MKGLEKMTSASDRVLKVNDFAEAFNKIIDNHADADQIRAEANSLNDQINTPDIINKFKAVFLQANEEGLGGTGLFVDNDKNVYMTVASIGTMLTILSKNSETSQKNKDSIIAALSKASSHSYCYKESVGLSLKPVT